MMRLPAVFSDTMRGLAAAVALVTALSAAAQDGSGSSSADDGGSSPSDIVWCHDVERSLVARTARWRCDGEVVSAAEAKRIKDRRLMRIHKALRPRQAPAPRKGGGRRGTGSGFFVTADGHVVTNHHVIDGCRAITVIPAGESASAAHVVADDETHDLAVLKTAPRKTFARFRDPAPLRQGDGLAVVGYPLHGKVAIKPILVRGHVLIGGGAPRPDQFAMKIDVRRGNSGGPILDSAGHVVGVVVAKINTPGVYASTGRLVRDLGYGIRQSVTLRFLERQGIEVATAPSRAAVGDDALMTLAHSFVAQITCLR